MRLYESMMTDCTLLEKVRSKDNLGSWKYEWSDGIKFRAAIVKNSTMEAKIAEKQGVTEVYTVTVPKGTPLEYHDAFRRDSDGAIFRVTSNIKDSETPSVSTFSFGQVSAESWELT